MSRALGSQMRVIFYATQICASAKSRSRPGFNRSRNSVAFSKDFRVNRRHNIAPIEYGPAESAKFARASKKTSEEMRCHNFLFLLILAIRVGFESNSMDPQ